MKINPIFGNNRQEQKFQHSPFSLGSYNFYNFSHPSTTATFSMKVATTMTGSTMIMFFPFVYWYAGSTAILYPRTSFTMILFWARPGVLNCCRKLADNVPPRSFLSTCFSVIIKVQMTAKRVIVKPATFRITPS